MTTEIPLLLALAASGMLLSAFVLSSRMRLKSFVWLFRFQSFCLGFYAVLLGVIHGEQGLFVMAALIVALKAGVLPYALLQTADRSSAANRLEAFFRPTTLSLIAASTIAFSFVIASRIFPGAGIELFIGGTAVSLLLVGLSLLVLRSDLFGQSIGFMVMENGIFTLGLSLVGGMPLFIEIGVFFDVLVLFIIMMALAYRVQIEHVSVKTEHLKELVG